MPVISMLFCPFNVVTLCSPHPRYDDGTVAPSTDLQPTTSSTPNMSSQTSYTPSRTLSFTSSTDATEADIALAQPTDSQSSELATAAESTSSGAIVASHGLGVAGLAGIVAGGVGALIIAGLVFCFLRFKKRKNLARRTFDPPSAGLFSPGMFSPRDAPYGQLRTTATPFPLSNTPPASPQRRPLIQEKVLSPYHNHPYAASNTYPPSELGFSTSTHTSAPDFHTTTSSHGHSVKEEESQLVRAQTQRQREIDRQLSIATSRARELALLVEDAQGWRSVQGGLANSSEMRDEKVIEEVRETLENVQERITALREQRRSSWALGLTNDPPPGYTPDPVPLQASTDMLIPQRRLASDAA